MTKKGHYIRDEEDIIVAINLAGGKVATAARLLGYADIQGLYARVQNNKLLRQVVLDAREDAIDKVEDKLQEAIDRGSVTAMIFFLTKQAKSRGYGADQTLLNVNVTQNNLIVDLSALSDVEVKQLEELVVKASAPKLLEAGTPPVGESDD